MHHNTWQLPLWIAYLKWVGVGLITTLMVVIVIFGLTGVNGVVVAGIILAFLFNSLITD